MRVREAAVDGTVLTRRWQRLLSVLSAGTPNLQKMQMTPASTDPVVGTLFATESEKYGAGVLHVATPEDLKGVKIEPGNWLAELEKEVGVAITPSEFAARAGVTLPAKEARQILRDHFGVTMPESLPDTSALNAALKDSPRLSEEQIELARRPRVP